MTESDRTLLNWRQLVGSFVALAILLTLAGSLLWFVISQVRSLDSEVAAAVITASATVVVSVVVVVLGRYYEKKRELEAQARDRKIPLYEKFIDFWFRVLYAEKLGEAQPSEQELLRAMVDFTRGSTVWASDSVIRKWRDARLQYVALGSQAQDQSNASIAALFGFEEMLLEMRKDTGHPRTRLARGDLLGLFIDDIGSLFSRAQEEQ
jgi:hypothetical protein